MDIGAISAISSSEVASESQVKVLNNQSDQLEKVVSTILEGLKASGPQHLGGLVDVRA